MKTKRWEKQLSPIERVKTLPMAYKTNSGYWIIKGRKGLWKWHEGRGLAVFGIWGCDYEYFYSPTQQLVTMARFYSRAAGHETIACFRKVKNTRQNIDVEPVKTGIYSGYQQTLTLKSI